MVRKLFITAFVLFASASLGWAYDFSAVAPSGQTLYYNTVNNEAYVVRPGTGDSYNNYVTGNLTIPSSVSYNGTTYSVTALDIVSGYGAFQGCSGLTSVTIPNSVASISDHAFQDCSGLTSITIGSGVTSIGDNAFAFCADLTSVNYTGTIDQWCNISFVDHDSNPVFYSHSLKIGGNLVTNLVIPNSVTSIGGYAFFGCTSLTSVTIPNSVTSIGDHAFHCSGLTSVTIGSGVTSIGYMAFRECASLTSVTIPNSVTSIGGYAFNACTDLTSVTIGNGVTSIGSYAFSGCTDLISITISNGVSSISEGTFYGCSSLTSITIPNFVTSIEDYVFYDCSGLTSLAFLNPTPPTIGSSAFQGTLANILTVHVPCGSLTSYASLLTDFTHFEEVYTSFSVESEDVTWGTVQIVTMPSCTDHTAVIQAVPVDGYRFSHWSTGATDNPYTVNVTEGMAIRAHFVANGGPNGVRAAEDDGVRIYSAEGRIVVEGATDEVSVFDMMGRSVRNNALPAGVYLVKIGDYPARKVVVIR